MTDRGETALRQSPATFEVGPSRMHWDGTALTIHIDERTVPHLDRLRGTIRVHPAAITGVELPLHPDGSHVWRPFAPVADIEVALDRPGWRWTGHGYLDANFGTRALEADFRTWTWARLPTRDGATCLYDATRRDGSTLAAAIRFDARGPGDRLRPAPAGRRSAARAGRCPAAPAPTRAPRRCRSRRCSTRPSTAAPPSARRSTARPASASTKPWTSTASRNRG